MKATDAVTSLDDPRVVEAMEEYLAALETGRDPDRRAFLERHADIAGLLGECLDSLEFVQQAARRLNYYMPSRTAWPPKKKSTGITRGRRSCSDKSPSSGCATGE